LIKLLQQWFWRRELQNKCQLNIQAQIHPPRRHYQQAANQDVKLAISPLNLTLQRRNSLCFIPSNVGSKVTKSASEP
jgi:hypothetical protein